MLEDKRKLPSQFGEVHLTFAQLSMSPLKPPASMVSTFTGVLPYSRMLSYSSVIRILTGDFFISMLIDHPRVNRAIFCTELRILSFFTKYNF